MATITSNSIPEFDATFRKYLIEYTITLEEGETINSLEVVSSAPTWCNVKNSSITNYSVEIELSTNNSLSSREAIITIELDTSISVYNDIITIRQSGFKIFPIWQDRIVRINTDAISVKYDVRYSNKKIFAGKAYVMPNTDYVEIDIAKICASYLNSSLEGIIDAPKSFNALEGVRQFGLYVNDELHSSYLMFNSYTYKPNPEYLIENGNYFVCLSDPIRKECDSRQYIVYSFFNALTTSAIIKTFHFNKDGINQVEFSGQVNGRTLYTTFEKVPEGDINRVTLINDSYSIKDTCCKYCLYYQNALGGWDSFLINGNDKKTDKITSYKYIKAINNNTKKFGTKKYLNIINSSYKLYTNHLTDDEASRMHHLLESTEVYLHNLEDDTIIPVNITNSSCEYKTFTNNGKKKFTYQIDVEESQIKIRQ